MRALLLFAITFCAAGAAAETPIPAFSDFPAPVTSTVKSPTVDISSHPRAKQYRTTLRSAARGKPTFAGHYVLAWWGCGNECQRSLIVDLKTGKVLGVVGTDEPLESARGFAVEPNSALLIADPPCQEGASCLSEGRSNIPVRYYILEATGLRLLRKVPCHVIKRRACT